MKKSPKKLSVTRLTIRNLLVEDLAHVNGGSLSGGTSVISVSSGTSVISGGTSVIHPSGGITIVNPSGARH